MPKVWAKVFDSASKAYYYYNVETYETTWDRPADFSDDEENLSVSEGLLMLKAVKMIQRNFRAKVARQEVRKIRARKKSQNMGDVGCKWIETKDPGSGDMYYYHVDTYETVWEPPQEWIRWDKKQNPEKYAAQKKKKAALASGAGGGLAALGLGGAGPSSAAEAAGGLGALYQKKQGFGDDGEAGDGGISRQGDGEKSPFLQSLTGQSKDSKVDTEAEKKAAEVAAKLDKGADVCLDKCVEKCPGPCCRSCTLGRCAWPFEGKTLQT